MAGKSGRKRKKDKNSPSQIVESEKKRTMASYSGSPMQGQSTPGQFFLSFFLYIIPYALADILGMLRCRASKYVNR